MIVQLKSVTFKIRSSALFIKGDKMEFSDEKGLVASIPLDQVVKVSDWGDVVYENTV